MKSLFVCVVLLATVCVANAAGFSAIDIPGAGLHHPGKIMIQNDGTSITAGHFFGDVKESLVHLRSTRALATKVFGPVLFDSIAHTKAPMPAYLSAFVEEAARTHGVDPRLVAAIASRESAYNPKAVS